MDGLVYISGEPQARSSPLERFLPEIPRGVASAFLSRHSQTIGLEPGAWILDPLGASPNLPIEVAANGYRTLVAVNNPVTRFLIDVQANPPSRSDFQAALAELAAVRKGEERLETQLQSLYFTACQKCQREVPAEAFVWERASGSLVARIYHCSCGDVGEHPATELDVQRAASLAATDGLHRARALERVAPPDDPDRANAEEALECYLPRAVYALITIINKLDGLSLSHERRRALIALILGACDEVSSLWPYPPDRPRPKQLSVPGRFLEKNIWMALERGVGQWTTAQPPLQVTTWPEIPSLDGGLCLFEGPIRSLAPHLKDLSAAAVITAIPRPNQAFWTLSALWAGWLWGREAAAPFKSVLRRRRYDWNWHAAALYSAFKNFTDQMPLNSPFFCIIPELEPAFLSAALLAAAGAGLDLGGLALRCRQDPAQVLFHRRAFAHEERRDEKIDSESVRQAMCQVMLERNEPIPYIYLHAAGLAAMADDHSLGWRPEALTQIHAPIQVALSKPEFLHISESQNIEAGMWALQEWDSEYESLPDRVEIVLVRLLQQRPLIKFADLEAAIYAELPGFLTPSLGLIRAVLQSYASESNGSWSLRTEDSPSARLTDLEIASNSLDELGARLGYTTVRKDPSPRRFVWMEDGSAACQFILLASAVVGRILRADPQPSIRSCLVLPGGRAGLLNYKLDRDPDLKSSAGHWGILKFRHLRHLLESKDLTREGFDAEFSTDPIEPPEQMKLF